ncbi:hypothetical protein CEXT_164861 [Caerostris extrusa]|uniref:Uncharacterized protein n=1 Tax=Caerostris extrusa TaxID=172846 RepID=A0AAV4YEN2_CAEEX|nr:hypothetical protein CEXT_164861 [Caerostris extrusa]
MRQKYLFLWDLYNTFVTADHFNTSCSCQPSSGNDDGISSIFASLVSKAVPHHKTSCAPKILPQTALTLWKIYRIDKSLLISAIGTLISYGILVGTLGSVQNSNNDN